MFQREEVPQYPDRISSAEPKMLFLASILSSQKVYNPNFYHKNSKFTIFFVFIFVFWQILFDEKPFFL